MGGWKVFHSITLAQNEVYEALLANFNYGFISFPLSTGELVLIVPFFIDANEL